MGLLATAAGPETDKSQEETIFLTLIYKLYRKDFRKRVLGRHLDASSKTAKGLGNI